MIISFLPIINNVYRFQFVCEVSVVIVLIYSHLHNRYKNFLEKRGKNIWREGIRVVLLQPLSGTEAVRPGSPLSGSVYGMVQE